MLRKVEIDKIHYICFIGSHVFMLKTSYIKHSFFSHTDSTRIRTCLTRAFANFVYSHYRYSNMSFIVDQVFPAWREDATDEFSNFAYWRDPIPEVPKLEELYAQAQAT